MDFSAFPKSSISDGISILYLPPLFLKLTHFLHLLGSQSCAFPSILRSTLNPGSSFSTTDSALRICFQMLGGSGLSVGLHCSSFRTSFLGLEDALSDMSCCCCCCCDCQALLKTIFGAGRGVESLSNKVLSPFGEITLWTQSASTQLFSITARDLVCQNCGPLSCARAKWFQ